MAQESHRNTGTDLTISVPAIIDKHNRPRGPYHNLVIPAGSIFTHDLATSGGQWWVLECDAHPQFVDIPSPGGS